jgi:hypothetical protein
MELSLALEQMTVLEKIAAIETIWKDLVKSTESIPIPAWHKDVLQARANKIEEGSSTFIDWSDAKDKLRLKTR